MVLLKKNQTQENQAQNTTNQKISDRVLNFSEEPSSKILDGHEKKIMRNDNPSICKTKTSVT